MPDHPPPDYSHPGLPVAQASGLPQYAPEATAIPLPSSFALADIAWSQLPESVSILGGAKAVPLSLWGLLVQFLGQGDLSKLCRTCRTFRQFLSPVIYATPSLTRANMNGFLRTLWTSDRAGWLVRALDFTDVNRFLSMATGEFYGHGKESDEKWKVSYREKNNTQDSEMLPVEVVWLAVIVQKCPGVRSLLMRGGGEPLWRSKTLELALSPGVHLSPASKGKGRMKRQSSSFSGFLQTKEEARPRPLFDCVVIRGDNTVNCLPTLMGRFLAEYCPIYMSPDGRDLRKEERTLHFDFGLGGSLLDKRSLVSWLAPPAPNVCHKDDAKAGSKGESSLDRKGEKTKKHRSFLGSLLRKKSGTAPVSDTHGASTSVEDIQKVEEEPKIRMYLDLSHMPRHVVDDSLLIALSRAPVTFTRLSLAYSVSFSEFSLSTMITSRRVIQLTLTGCAQLTPNILPDILSSRTDTLDLPYSGIRGTAMKIPPSNLRELSLDFIGNPDIYDSLASTSEELKSDISKGLQLSPTVLSCLKMLRRVNLNLNSADEWQLRPTTDWNVLLPQGSQGPSPGATNSPTRIVSKPSGRVWKKYVKPERAYAIPTPSMLVRLAHVLSKPCLITLGFMEEGKHVVHEVRNVYVPDIRSVQELWQETEEEEEEEVFMTRPLLSDVDVARLNALLSREFGEGACRVALVIQ